MYKGFYINIAITLQAVKYSRSYVQKMVMFEARWRTSASKKLQNSIETSSSVSATLDLLFPLSESFDNYKKRLTYLLQLT